MSSCEVMSVGEKAFWRGLEFEWRRDDIQGSNRLAIHQYTDRDDHSVKPIGNDPDGFTVRGYICGDRLRDRIREFREAFKRRGAGRLYDPWLNEDLTVYVRTWNISLGSNLLGAEFVASFVEVGEEPYDAAQLSPLSAFADAVETLETDSTSAFLDTFGVTNDRAIGVGPAISDAQDVWDYISDSLR